MTERKNCEKNGPNRLLCEKEIVDYKELFKRLKTTANQVGNNWKKWPHFKVNDGQHSLRNVRFIYCDVIEYLRNETEQERCQQNID